MLTPAQVEALYAPKPSKKKGLGKVLTSEGWTVIEKMGDYNFGGFQGKAGTIRRNRKGATRRLPNGSRRHFMPYMEGIEVIAYKLNSK